MNETSKEAFNLIRRLAEDNRALRRERADLIEALEDVTAICAAAAPDHDLAIARARVVLAEANPPPELRDMGWRRD